MVELGVHLILCDSAPSFKMKNGDVYSAVPRHISIPLNWYGCPKNESKFLKTSPIFLNFNQFNNCPFFLPNYFITLFSCLASKSS